MTEHLFNPKVKFGKYENKCYSELPESYLLWMIKEKPFDWQSAERELQRREALKINNPGKYNPFRMPVN